MPAAKRAESANRARAIRARVPDVAELSVEVSLMGAVADPRPACHPPEVPAAAGLWAK